VLAASESHSWGKVAKEPIQQYDAVMGERRRTILGISFETRGQSAAVCAIDDAFNAGQRLNIAFANAHSVNIATGDPAFLAALTKFWVLNDGVGIDIASRIKFGKPFSENLNGTDFVPNFLRSSRHRFRIFMVGAREEVVAKAAEKLQERFPQHEIAGFHHGYFGPEDNAAICQRIRMSKANVVLVAMGSPRQEFWIADNWEATGAEILFGVGALFDFISGRVQRAPQWMRSARFEWLYRLAQEPRRLWRRYLIGNLTFLQKVLFDQWAGREPPTSFEQDRK
jgi:alpha-1,3-mannosyltransferase